MGWRKIKLMAEKEIIKQNPDDFQAEKADKSEFRRAAEMLVDWAEKNMVKQKAWELDFDKAESLLNEWGFNFNREELLEDVYLNAKKYSEEKHAEEGKGYYKKPTFH